MQLKEPPSEQEWTVSAEKVSLMDNPKLEVPPHISFECPHLSTLILQYCCLRTIPESLFKHMPGLNVLDLSGNNIVDLPNSISILKNLNALILAYCNMLKYLPSLAELRTLRKLDLYDTRIKEIPHGMEMLKNLRYLYLWSVNLKQLPVGILPVISHIQCLILQGLQVMGEEVGKLRKLEYVSCSFSDMQEFKKYAESIQGKWPTDFYFEVGSFAVKPFRFCPDFKQILRRLICENCEMERFDDIVDPFDLDTICIRKCDDFKCLSNIPLFRTATALTCSINECEGIECVVDLSLSACNALQNIEYLFLEKLCNLRELVRVGVAAEFESTSHAPTPPATFSSLKLLQLCCCSRIKKLLPVELLQGLQNLETIDIVLCEEMEEIIASEENHKGEGTTFILPKLKSLRLDELPKLKSICTGGIMISSDSLQQLFIYKCPELKRIPLSLPLLEKGQPSPPPFLKTIIVDTREWWESVEWDQPDVEDVLSPFVTYYLE
ncbi:hypothetical protein QUC31_001957 [Theobroma cacao]